MVKGFHYDRWDALLAIYGYFLTQEGGRHVSVQDLKRRAPLLQASAYVSLLLNSLAEDGHLESDVGEGDEDVFTFTQQGIVRAEEEVLARGLTLDQFELQFASQVDAGLIADTRHREVEAAKQALEELNSHLKQDNDIGNISAEERDSALHEVSELKNTLESGNVRINYLWSKANETLLWIIEKGAGAAVSEIAKRALTHIHNFINVFFN